MISAAQACILAGWLALAANAHAFPGIGADLQEYETAYACEESLLNITCPVGLNLNIIRANFGRFSIAICNPNGVTDYSVNCMAPRTLRVIRSRCQGENTCEVPVDSRIFGDPCPSTRKYVEVHYTCTLEIVTSTTSRPRPPWFPESPPKSWADLSPPPSTSTSSTTSTVSTTPEIDSEDFENEHDYADQDSDKIIKVKVPKPQYPREEENNRLRIPIPQSVPSPTPSIQQLKRDPSAPVSSSRIQSNRYHDSYATNSNNGNNNYGPEDINDYCGPLTARGLHWNWTRAGDTAVLECPSGSIGFAKWKCDRLVTTRQPQHLLSGNGGSAWRAANSGAGHGGLGETAARWSSLSPSLAECQSKWLANLDSRLRDGESISGVSGDLAQLSGLQPLYGGDLMLASKMLKHMAERMNYDIQVVSDLAEKESLVTELVQNVVLTASHLLDRINHVSWTDLSSDDVSIAATGLMKGLEQNAFLLAESVANQKIIIKPTNNILLSVRVMDAKHPILQRFPAVENLEDWSRDQNVGVWSGEDSIQLSPTTLKDSSEEGVIRVVFTTFNEFDEILVPDQKPDGPLRFLNSKVISASLGKAKHAPLLDPVRISFKHLRTVNVSNPVCVFWNYTTRFWSEDGCKLIASNLTHSQCECEHLTNFALIMDEGSNGVAFAKTAVTDQITIIIASVATLVCVTILLFSIVITWRRFKVTYQCRAVLQKSGIPCFHKTKELSEKDKKQGNFYTVTPKLNGLNTDGSVLGGQNIEMDTEQYFQHMLAMQKSQDSLGQAHKSVRRNTISAADILRETNNGNHQETALNEQQDQVHTQQPLTLNFRKTLKMKNNCGHATIGPASGIQAADIAMQRKMINNTRAMSPFNHIYMEIDPKTDTDHPAAPQGAVYETMNQSETYMLSSVSDMSEEDFRRASSDVSRQSSNRYAENKPLLRQGLERSMFGNAAGIQSQSMRLPAHLNNNRNSLLPSIAGLRFQDQKQQQGQNLNLVSSHIEPIPFALSNGEIIHGLNQNGEPIHTLNLTEEQIKALNLDSLPILTNENGLMGHPGMIEARAGQEAPLQVTTVNGNQFVCLNLQDDAGNNTSTYVAASDLHQYSSFSDTYIQGAELRGINTANFAVANSTPSDTMTSAMVSQVQASHHQPVTTEHGMIHNPVHSQFVVQRVGTLPRQYAHPLAQI